VTLTQEVTFVTDQGYHPALPTGRLSGLLFAPHSRGNPRQRWRTMTYYVVYDKETRTFRSDHCLQCTDRVVRRYPCCLNGFPPVVSRTLASMLNADPIAAALAVAESEAA
jgi:hypothetical protein